jgi:phosphate transport system ATP-binding protein
MTDHLRFSSDPQDPTGSPSMTTPDEHQQQGGGPPGAAPGDTPEVASAAPINRLAELASRHDDDPVAGRETVFELKDVTVSYSGNPAIREVGLAIHRNLVTAFIGPSGCGKTTLLRSLNRLNDLINGAVVDGSIRYHGHDLYGTGVDAVEVRRRIGMVFQRPNPFPKSVYDNVAFGLRLHGMKDNLDDRVESALRHAALWDEVKDRLKTSALSLSGGQQQRLCIARALAIEPDVILMDEPASALDPISTQAIEDLVDSLKNEYTIIIVTHNMQQASRVADVTAFFSVEVGDAGSRCGVLVEMGPTSELFIRPVDPRTEAYVTGRFG